MRFTSISFAILHTASFLVCGNAMAQESGAKKSYNENLETPVYFCSEPRGTRYDAHIIIGMDPNKVEPESDRFRGLSPVVAILGEVMLVGWGKVLGQPDKDQIWKAKILHENWATVTGVYVDSAPETANSSVLMFTFDRLGKILYFTQHKFAAALKGSSASTFVSFCKEVKR